MSILYEALHETQEQTEAQVMLPPDNMTWDDWIDVAISLTIAFLLGALIVVHYPQLNNKTIYISNKNTPIKYPINVASKSINTQTAMLTSDEKAYQSRHILNGVYVSEEEKIAMVNNRFFSIGDNIDGMKVVNIELDKIKLHHNNNIIELHVVS